MPLAEYILITWQGEKLDQEDREKRQSVSRIYPLKQWLKKQMVFSAFQQTIKYTLY